MIEAVVFDLDDTLYNYTTLNEVAVQDLSNYCCVKFGIDSLKFLNVYNKARTSTKNGLENVASGHNRIIYFQRILEELNINPISYALEMYEVYWGKILNEMELNEGVMDVLGYLKNRKIKIGICTDLTTHIQHRKLKTLKIENYINSIVTSEEAGIEKPNKNPFEMLLNKLSVEAKNTIYVGDSFEKDVIGSGDMGMYPIWYNICGKFPNRDVKFKYSNINNISEVINIINGLERQSTNEK